MRLTELFTGFAGIALMLSLSVGVSHAYDLEFDYNEDGVVNQADLDILGENLGLGEGDAGFDSRFDHDGDGIVGGTDVLLSHRAVAGQ